MKSKINRISQAPTATPDVAPPMPSAPTPAMPSGPDMGLGMPPMAPTSMGGDMGGAGAATQQTLTQPSLFPLTNLGMILKDFGIEKELSETLSSSSNINTTSEEEIANLIWEMYGGHKLGKYAIKSKKGTRIEGKEVDPKELERTEKTRWKRLPLGKTLSTLDIPITLKDVEKAVKSISFGISKAKAKEAPAGGGALATNKNSYIKIAKDLDNLGFYHISDSMI